MKYIISVTGFWISFLPVNSVSRLSREMSLVEAGGGGGSSVECDTSHACHQHPVIPDGIRTNST